MLLCGGGWTRKRDSQWSPVIILINSVNHKNVILVMTPKCNTKTVQPIYFNSIPINVLIHR